MDSGVKSAIVTAAAAIIAASIRIVAAAVNHILTTRQKRNDELRQRKIEQYKALLAAISDLAVLGLNDETDTKYASAFNMIALTAPQSVINALLDFHDEIQVSNPNRSLQRHNELLKKLVLEIRRSLELPFRDDPNTFRYQLAGGPQGRTLPKPQNELVR
jgi:hypothetical protein